MSYKPNSKEIEAVVALPAPKRMEYFIGKVTDWEELWSSGDESGWTLMADDSGREVVPVWPAQEYASLCCTGSDTPKKILLADWLAKWIPGTRADGRKIAVFPVPSSQGIVMTPDELEQALTDALQDYE